MVAKGITPILNVSDIQESFAWFEKLGWKKGWEWGTPPTFGGVCSGEHEIFLCLGAQGGRGKSAFTKTFGPDGDDGAEKGVWMSLWVDDVDAVHRECVAAGLEITWPPTDMPWNVREMHVRHPDGHVFRISRGLEEPEMSRDTASPGESKTTIAPMLSVRRGAAALEFYKQAFHAEERFRIDNDKGEVVARLAVGGAEYWIADESPAHANFSPESVGGSTARFVFTVEEPDAVFERAIAAGAKVVGPISNQHGWRVGRLVDPFGHHWEIGKPLTDSNR